MEHEGRRRRRYQSGSFLVRFWVEPDAEESEQGLRGTVKNLKTGEEQHLADPGAIGDVVRRHLADDPGVEAGKSAAGVEAPQPRAR